MENKKELPSALRPWSAEIEATRRPFIEVRTSDQPLETVTQSRLGGLPYWPKYLTYPSGAKGLPMYLLAQIYFAEVPSLPPFPDHGLLQIFISDDSLYGMDYELPQWQKDFRIVYHEELQTDADALLKDFSFLPEAEDFPMPSQQSSALEFNLQESHAPADDQAFAQQLGKNFWNQFGHEKWKIKAEYRKYASAGGHKMGGYPHFPQEDPREPGQVPFLLLQLDSDVRSDLNWGDRGTAHFFIAEEDLSELDFSRAYYGWSSY